MPLQMLEPRRLYRQIADQIGALIAAGEFPPGSRLPPDRDLAQQLGVSRQSVREALIALEISGLIDVRGGSGIYVNAGAANAALANAASADDGPGPLELLRARALVEGEIAAIAAKQITREELALLDDTLAGLDGPGTTYSTRDDADRLFHLTIAEATRNSALVQAVRLFWDQGRGPMWKKIEEHFHTAALRRQTVSDHKAVLDALRDGKPAAARKCMRLHIGRVEKEFTQGWHVVTPGGAELQK